MEPGCAPCTVESKWSNKKPLIVRFVCPRYCRNELPSRRRVTTYTIGDAWIAGSEGVRRRVRRVGPPSPTRTNNKDPRPRHTPPVHRPRPRLRQRPRQRQRQRQLLQPRPRPSTSANSSISSSMSRRRTTNISIPTRCCKTS